MKKFEQQKADRLLNDGNQQQVENKFAVEGEFKTKKTTKKIKEKRSHWGAFRC
jgi:hypothetical protein